MPRRAGALLVMTQPRAHGSFINQITKFPNNQILRSVRKRFVPPPQEKLAIALRVALVSEDGEAFAEAMQKLLTIMKLHFGGATAIRLSRFPGIDFGGHFDIARGLNGRVMSIAQQRFHAW